MLATFLVPARHLLDQRHMVGAEIGENVLDPEIDQTFEEIMSSRMAGHVLPAFPHKPVAQGADAGDVDLDHVAMLEIG